jgi:hypothetical protein
MRRVRRWLLIAVPLVALLTPWLWSLLDRSHGVTRANFERIQEGMTRDEVGAIMGQECERNLIGMGAGLMRVSYSERATIEVTFSNDDKVVSKSFHPWTIDQTLKWLHGVLAWLRLRLGL